VSWFVAESSGYLYLDNSLKKQLAFSQLTNWVICRL